MNHLHFGANNKEKQTCTSTIHPRNTHSARMKQTCTSTIHPRNTYSARMKQSHAHSEFQPPGAMDIHTTNRPLFAHAMNNHHFTHETPPILALISILFITYAIARLIRRKTRLFLIAFSSLPCTTNSASSSLRYSGRHDHGCILGRNQAAKCWGNNFNGRLGYGDENHRGDQALEMGNRLPVVDLGSNFTPMQIVTGAYHTCALSTNNAVKCWGNNYYMQLGYGDNVDRGKAPNQMGDYLPEIDLGLGFTPIQLGFSNSAAHTCAISDANKLKCWGMNYDTQVGRSGSGSLMGQWLTETELGSGFAPTEVVLGWWFTCALSANYNVKCWGDGQFGQLGYGDASGRGGSGTMGDSLPNIDLGSDFVPIQITAGSDHVCALSTTKTVKCFGRNEKGQLGYEHTNNIGDGPNEMGDDLPIVDLGSSFIPMQIETGHWHTCAVSTAYKAKCWGNSQYGQLGYSDRLTRGSSANQMGDKLPEIDLGSNFEVQNIIPGRYYTCAVSTTNKVKCWGQNAIYGMLGYGDTNDRGKVANEMGDNLPEIDLGTNFMPEPTPKPSNA
eukprot:181840_1